MSSLSSKPNIGNYNCPNVHPERSVSGQLSILWIVLLCHHTEHWAHWSHWAAPGSIFSHPPLKNPSLSSLNPTKAEWFSRHRVFSFQCYLNIHSEHLKFPTIVVEKQEHAAKLNGAGSFKTVHGIVQPTVLSHNYDVYLKHCIRVLNCGPNFVIVLDDGIIGCIV